MSNEEYQNLNADNAFHSSSTQNFIKQNNDLLENMIIIKNPTNEIAIGVICKEDLIEDSHNYVKEKEIDNISNNSIFSDKLVTYQSYGILSYASIQQLNQFNLNFSSLSPITQRSFFNFKIENLLVKYTIVILTFIQFILDLKNLKVRFTSQEEIISELRSVHIQMDDTQLYQILWSFIIVYVGLVIAYFFSVSFAIILDSYSSIKVAFRFMVCSLIYLIIEIILRKVDFTLIFLKVIVIMLIKKWLNLSIMIFQATLMNPEFRNISLGPRMFN